jgi:hypothetical protein
MSYQSPRQALTQGTAPSTYPLLPAHSTLDCQRAAGAPTPWAGVSTGRGQGTARNSGRAPALLGTISRSRQGVKRQASSAE